MRITVVGAVLIAAAVIGAVLLIRHFNEHKQILRSAQNDNLSGTRNPA
jgi:hypothetical protein